MKIIVLIAILLNLGTSSLFAQLMKKKDLDVMIGPALLLPNSNFRNTHHAGFGLESKLEYMVGKHASATGGIAFSFLPVKPIAAEVSENLLPLSLKLGGRYFFGNFFGIAEVGALVFIRQNAASGFLYSVGIGDKIKLSDEIFDINLRYESWPGIDQRRSMVALGIAYQFVVH
jgi:hypothetical protein